MSERGASAEVLSIAPNLAIAELGQATPIISPGGTANLSIQLQPGTYTIYCAVKGHRERGMEGRVVGRVRWGFHARARRR